METEELIKLVDGIYKNILDKFNPGARQMINAGKAYLKALHGAAAASRLYVEAIAKLARQAQLGTWGGSSDIGAALMKIVEVYKEIQDQQMIILKAFYVDLLVPLETNLEKDTKVVQSEQKKFLQQHKHRSETYSKAAAMMKKQRKKSRGSTKSGIAMDKELKNMQVLEEEKTKLDAFCEQSLKSAMTQERRRYGFVLERHCSLAKHYLSYYNQGVVVYQQNIDEWSEVAKTREYLPDDVENMFSSKMRDVYSTPRIPQFEDDQLSITSQLRKTKSMDASCLDIRSIGDAASPMLSLSRAKSDFNLTASTHSLAQDSGSPVRRPKSMALPVGFPPPWDVQLARALYAYLSSGENQLSFLEGDIIALVGDKNKGWQFGENLRTQCSGWFPLAYTEILDDPTILPSHYADVSGSNVGHMSSASPGTNTLQSFIDTNTPVMPISPHVASVSTSATIDQQIPRMFGDTLHLHRSYANAKQIRRVTGINNYIPPPALPAPVPTPTLPFSKTQMTSQNPPNFNFPSQNSGYSANSQGLQIEKPLPMPPMTTHVQTKNGKIGNAIGNISLHSSNDSGFSNDPPPQPEADYSDDESSVTLSKVPIRKSLRSYVNDNNNSRVAKPVRPPISTSANELDSKNYLNENQQDILRAMHLENTDKKGIIKRTKSFWKFGKYSNTEILEGMSLWKHRDLVDVKEKPISAVVHPKYDKPVESNDTENNGSEKSTDSDKTLNAMQLENTEQEEYGKITEQQIQKQEVTFNKKQNLSLPPQSAIDIDNDTEFENHFDRSEVFTSYKNHKFYDDEGDGLIMRTVNRKDILKQYSNDSNLTTDAESDSEITSDDPYDCIVVDDHTTMQNVKKNVSHRVNFPNVAEIGKKLEQFSKSSKYLPYNKENIHLEKEYRNSINDKINNINIENQKRNNQHISVSVKEPQEILTYRNNRNIQLFRSPTPEQKHSFTTFGIDENEMIESKQENIKIKSTPQPKARRKHEEYSENEMDMTTERQNKYHDNLEKYKSNMIHPGKQISNENSARISLETERQEKYQQDESKYSENRQFLPRTKLAKNNNGTSMQTSIKFEQEILDYNDTIVKNKKKEYKCEETPPDNGNIYGPWYDLWGLDATVQK